MDIWSAKVSKRSSQACSRCRRQKIRCNGNAPCDQCVRRNLHCESSGREQRVTVTRGFLEDLQRKAESRTTHSLHRRQESDAQSSPPRSSLLGEANDEASSVGHDDEARKANDQHVDDNSPLADNTPLTNPLVAGKSSFTIDPNGRTLYLGTSSNWAFARRVLGMVHEAVWKAPLPTETLVFDSCTYDLGWPGLQVGERSARSVPVLPSKDHSLHLVELVRFHCGQLFHLWNEITFMRNLHAFYAQDPPTTTGREIWYAHFLLVLAFGKAFSLRRSHGNRPPGADFFIAALEALPHHIFLFSEPLLAAEVLCCVALYLQCIDYRMLAHNYIGQALRITVGNGCHTDMPMRVLGYATVERSRRIFWTVYTLDQELTSLIGSPQCSYEYEVHQALPDFQENNQRRTTLEIRIRLSKTISQINRSVYGADGKLNSRFLVSTKNVLAGIAEVADELRRDSPLHLGSESFSGLSRVSAHLHLQYHQCIVLATRPLLFCFLKLRLESPEVCARSLCSLPHVRNLVQMCLDACSQMIEILDALRIQGLLEAFLPFDLEAVFISSVSLLAGSSFDNNQSREISNLLRKAYAIFDDMVDSGNLIAKQEKQEVRSFEDALGWIKQDGQVSAVPTTASPLANASMDWQSGVSGVSLGHSHQMHTPTSLPTVAQPFEFANLDDLDLFTSAHILDTANAIDTGDADWMSQAMTDYNLNLW